MQANLRLNWMIAIAIMGWLMYLLAPVLTPFIAAGLLAYMGDPFADWLQKHKISRTLAVVIVFLTTFLLLGLLFLLVGPLVSSQIGALVNALPDIAHQVEQVWLPNVLGWLNIEPGDDVGIKAFLSRYSEMLGAWSGKVILGVSKSGGVLAAAVLSLFLVPILTFYMLRDWDAFMSNVGALLPPSQRETVFALARETDDMLGAFLRGQLLVMLALAVIYSLGLALVGVKFAIAIGVVAGLVSFVPYLGFVFGIGLAGLTVALEPNPLWHLAGVIATFTVAQVIEGSLLTPKLVGDRIGLHPVLVIFAVAAGGQLFGFFGILLALPAAAVLSVLVRFAYHRYLTEHPELEPVEGLELNELQNDSLQPESDAELE